MGHALGYMLASAVLCVLAAGAGIYSADSNVTIERNHVRNNECDRGAGISAISVSDQARRKALSIGLAYHTGGARATGFPLRS